MELLTLKITPLSSFATVPKGDTLFGQIVAYLFLKNDKSFENYLNEKPKLIVSDMMPLGYVYKPTLPLSYFKANATDEVDKKQLRKRNFITLSNLQEGNLHLCERVDYIENMVSVKNSINRTTFTTDGSDFAPYGLEEKSFFRELWMFVLVDNTLKKEVLQTIKEVGNYGFGKEGNIGKGNFEVEVLENSIKDLDTQYYMSLSPTILKDTNIEKSWYEPFTRFGKFGLHNADFQAFKKPTLLADSSAVVKLKANKPYFGFSVNNATKEKPSFQQGYSIVIPIKLKDNNV